MVTVGWGPSDVSQHWVNRQTPIKNTPLYTG